MRVVGLEEHFATEQMLAAWRALRPDLQDIAGGRRLRWAARLIPSPVGEPTITPEGTSLYVTNPDDSKVHGFVVNANDGTLAPMPGLPFPAGAGVGSVTADQQYVFLGNRDDNTVGAYDRDPSSGLLTFLQATGSGGNSPEFNTGHVDHPDVANFEDLRRRKSWPSIKT